MATARRAAPIVSVRDLDAAMDFYRRLGFSVHIYRTGVGYGFASRDGIEIHLGVPRREHHPSSAYLFVDDADQLAEAWQAAGIEVFTPQYTEWGQHEGVLVDPGGNTIRFGSPMEEAAEGRGHANLQPSLFDGRQPRGCGWCWCVVMADVVVTDVELAELTALWERRCGGLLPLGRALGRGDERWVRFHSLPGSKRYAQNEEEYGEILRRHFTVLGELGVSAPVWVATTQWSVGPEPEADDAARLGVHPGSRYWRTVREAGDPDAVWWHLYVSLEPAVPERIGGLLRAVADWEQVEVLIADRGLDWLYHPYDGGADIYARDGAERDELRAVHVDWLSRHPSGM